MLPRILATNQQNSTATHLAPFRSESKLRLFQQQEKRFQFFSPLPNIRIMIYTQSVSHPSIHLFFFQLPKPRATQLLLFAEHPRNYHLKVSNARRVLKSHEA
ncbi:uncharacterized protein RSE6_06851 [Rhynchosporium secalis]|uniref:Uncharacterized protein n=1 Tax=Rhynchosporium secalis TaxID=38038 RepID=A0A1E1MCE3_RHYSE|nr:uncharacterized protein RSE6_06851 [Rhynchosporium secalis]